MQQRRNNLLDTNRVDATMKIQFLLVVGIVSICLDAVASFAPATVNRRTRSQSLSSIASSRDDEVPIHSRRDFFANAFVASAGAVGLLNSPAPASADVADGNELPQGVAQFARIARGKVEILVRAIYRSLGFFSAAMQICTKRKELRLFL